MAIARLLPIRRDRIRVVDAVIVPRDQVVRPASQLRAAVLDETPLDEVFGSAALTMDVASAPQETTVVEIAANDGYLAGAVLGGEIDEPVSVPTAGEAHRPEDLIATDESLTVAFDDMPARGDDNPTPIEETAPVVIDERPLVATEGREGASVDEPERVATQNAFELEGARDEREPASIDPLGQAPIVDENTCTIAVWRGYRKSAFYARGYDAEGEEVALAESPTFRYRGNGIPERTDLAGEAHQALLDLLRREGWEAAGQGSYWFELTLTRG